MADLNLDSVTKVYDDAKGTETAVDSLSLTVRDGEFLTLVGPSGCGKSTTLRMIAGLEKVTSGTISIGKRPVQRLAPDRRNVAMVFQNFALYKKMTVRENIGYGLKHTSDLAESERRQSVEEMANMLGISETLDDNPGQLSGGQKQRVALGRALVRDPDVFLLDEPLSNLDAKLRSEMRTELQRIHDQLGVTTIYVTHNQKEAMTMSDRIAVMSDGALQQIGKSEDIYDHPENKFVGTFLGSPAMNIFEVSIRHNNDDSVTLLTDSGQKLSTFPDSNAVTSMDTAMAGIRPEDVILESEGNDAQVLVTEFQGNINYIHTEYSNQQVTARVSPDQQFNRGEQIGIQVDPTDLYLFDAQSGETITARNRPVQLAN